MAEIKDSGERTEFSTGAVRDMHKGKGDMVSLPNSAILRLSKHYEAGAEKYGRWNYTNGIPVSSFMDSALRHIFKYLAGWDDEDHLSAAAFNILGALEMEERHPDMLDLPERKGKNTFSYGGAEDGNGRPKESVQAPCVENPMQRNGHRVRLLLRSALSASKRNKEVRKKRSV